MKKIILVAVAGLFVLVSCKKAYTCECVHTDTTVANTEYPIEKSKKRDAILECDRHTASYEGGAVCSLK
jgi:uncharacterized protein YcfL